MSDPFNNPFGALKGALPDLPSQPKQDPAPSIPKGPARAVVRMEKKGRGGKEVTVVDQLSLSPSDQQAWLKALKGALGCGGTLENGGLLVLQGDQRERLPSLLEKRGVRKVIVG